MSFIAQYKSRCADCDTLIAPGQEAEYDVDDQAVHVDCEAHAPETEFSAPKGVALCQNCFTYHRGECA
ncbi:hypothetical protein K8O93_00840 [Gordonia bronchialis]|uniref:hypothetical protein n=1 Tax=Gordonia bronchialis TaxID=2054 RepID=UPI001CC02824|nr:hypothetical protein [Gordonia bronchialis]UAK38379.1 hypothetical protein K8O93_00840 [Gordonia bronchialis]